MKPGYDNHGAKYPPAPHVAPAKNSHEPSSASASGL